MPALVIGKVIIASNTLLGYSLFALDVYGVAILDVHAVLDVLLRNSMCG